LTQALVALALRAQPAAQATESAQPAAVVASAPAPQNSLFGDLAQPKSSLSKLETKESMEDIWRDIGDCKRCGLVMDRDHNAAINLDERYTAALFTRNFNTYGFLAQIRLGDLYRVGYAFEVPTNSSVGTRFTTHEFSFGVNLAFLKSHETTITNF